MEESPTTNLLSLLQLENGSLSTTTEQILSQLSSEQLERIEQSLRKAKQRLELTRDRDAPTKIFVPSALPQSPIQEDHNAEIKPFPIVYLPAPLPIHQQRLMRRRIRRRTAYPESDPTFIAPVLLSVFSEKNPNPSFPHTCKIDAIPYIVFAYKQCGDNFVFYVRTDIDSVDIPSLTSEFLRENCIYPRADCKKEQYIGNRWQYESECNNLGWKLAWRNNALLAGKRGLLQRSVDCYRNHLEGTRSRRVMREERLRNKTEEEPKKKRRREEEVPKTLNLVVGERTLRLRIESPAISDTMLMGLEAQFRMSNAVYPRALGMADGVIIERERWQMEMKCNMIAWRLAFLNPSKFGGKKILLQRAVDAYRRKFCPEMQPRQQTSNRSSD